MKRATLGFVTIVAILSATAGADIFDDGGTHNVTSDVGSVYIYDGSSGPTSVNFQTGSSASEVWAYNHSQVNVNDGLISGSVNNQDQSTMTMNGGKIASWTYLFGDSQFTLNNGTIEGWVYASSGTSQFNMYGGTITGAVMTPGANSTTNLHGGTIGEHLYAYNRVHLDGTSVLGNLYAYDGSMVSIHSGSFGEETYHGIYANEGSQIDIYGGNMANRLGVMNGGRVDIYGSNFNKPFGALTSSGTLTGTLSNGDLISVNYGLYGDTATLVLHEHSVVPLPGAVLLGSLGLGIAGWRLRRKES